MASQAEPYTVGLNVILFCELEWKDNQGSTRTAQLVLWNYVLQPYLHFKGLAYLFAGF